MNSNASQIWHPTIEQMRASNLFEFISKRYPELLANAREQPNPSSGNEDHERAPAETPFDAAYLAKSLHRESIDHSGLFWRNVWEHFGLIGDLGPSDSNNASNLWEHRFFPEGKMNFAENILAHSGPSDALALIACDEKGTSKQLTKGELLEMVLKVATWMRSRGIGQGDRVAGVLSNGIEAIVAFLASSTLGAIWTCCAPEFGDDAIVDRFGQTAPKLLVMGLESQYNGKQFDLSQRLERLLERLPSLEGVLITNDQTHSRSSRKVRFDCWKDVLAVQLAVPWQWERFEWNHPLYILYSSGTTGVPKCIVHGAGGSLLQHVKEQRLHSDLKNGERIFYFTTTGWMMWNWLVSALASRATIVLFDGSPMYPDPGVLWKLAQDHKVTHFGASARYYAALEKIPYVPRYHFNLDSIRVLLSTGSPLLPEQYHWLYQSIHSDIHLTSISGGTDIVSCFVLGHPMLGVAAGEIQTKGLGMDVQVLDETGRQLFQEPGELVCKNAFPSLPLGFWDDPKQERYRRTYWERYPGIWWHGDWAMETASGSMVIYGRSDATLNPGGVRIGTAEIYRQLEGFPEILESVATAWRHDGDEKIVLFIKLNGTSPSNSEPSATNDLQSAIRHRIRTFCSPRHVPSWIVSVADLPKTMNGKLSEIAVRNAITKQQIGNVGALSNPECLDFFRAWQPD
jgi:acetoacetyl-CoA synthetase